MTIPENPCKYSSDDYGFMDDKNYITNNINGDLEAALDTRFGAAVVFGVWFNISLTCYG